MNCEKCGIKSEERICDKCYDNIEWKCDICQIKVISEEVLIYCECGKAVCEVCWVDKESRDGWDESECIDCHKKR